MQAFRVVKLGLVGLQMVSVQTAILLDPANVGGWNASAKLDYQFAGLLNFKISPRWTISPGYRYLFVDYRSGNSIYNMTIPGALLGLTYTVGSTTGK